jgi:hypothetical protein
MEKSTLHQNEDESLLNSEKNKRSGVTKIKKTLNHEHSEID